MSAETPAPPPSTALVHVAAAAERRGRVVVAMRTALPGTVPTSLALDLAHFFSARIDAVYLQEQEIFAAAAHAFASEIGFSGRTQGPLDLGRLHADCRSMQAAAFGAILRAARTTGIDIATRIAPAEDAHALSRVCADEGPWNIVVLADGAAWPETRACTALLSGGGATAMVVAGRNARRRNGPALLIVSEPDRLPAMLRAARILSELEPEPPAPPLLLPLVGGALDVGDDLEGTLRLAVSAMPPTGAPVVLAPRAVAADRATESAAIEKSKPGFIVAHTSIDEDTFRHVMGLVAAAACPALIVH